MVCDDAGVVVITGDTKVVERRKGYQILINTTGIRFMHPIAKISVSRIEERDKIVVSGNIAYPGTTIMAVREGQEFETNIESDTRNLNKMSLALLDKFGTDIKFFRDPTRGGVATVLNEIAKEAEREIEIEQSLLSVKPQVQALCEILGLDSLYVANEGIFICIVKSKIASDCLDVLKQFEGGKEATIIGEVKSSESSKVILKSEIGGRRVVGMLVREQLPRIC